MEATDTDVYLVIPLCSIALCLKINITVCFSFLIWSYLMFVMLNISEGKTDLHLSTHDGNEKRVWSIRWVAKWRNTQIPISAKCNTGYVSICVCVYLSVWLGITSLPFPMSVYHSSGIISSGLLHDFSVCQHIGPILVFYDKSATCSLIGYIYLYIWCLWETPELFLI